MNDMIVEIVTRIIIVLFMYSIIKEVYKELKKTEAKQKKQTNLKFLNIRKIIFNR